MLRVLWRLNLMWYKSSPYLLLLLGCGARDHTRWKLHSEAPRIYLCIPKCVPCRCTLCQKGLLHPIVSSKLIRATICHCHMRTNKQVAFILLEVGTIAQLVSGNLWAGERSVLHASMLTLALSWGRDCIQSWLPPLCSNPKRCSLCSNCSLYVPTQQQF